MKLCPIAWLAGCKKCLAFKACPLKGVIGDYKKPDESQTNEHAKNVSSDANTDQ